MYNLFQENLEKVPNMFEGTPYLCTFTVPTVYGSASTKKCYLVAAYHSSLGT